jgi:alkane 1-monooxygenase
VARRLQSGALVAASNLLPLRRVRREDAVSAAAPIVLPLVTTSLPFVAGLYPALNGTLAGLVAVAAPLVVDLGLVVRGGGARDEEALAPIRAPAFRAYHLVLFHLYAVGFVVFFSAYVMAVRTLPLVDVVGRGLSWVVLSGVPTLVVGHALIHGRSRAGRLLGQSLFSLLNYPDFPMHHIEAHHRHVATKGDIHSAPKGQSFYRFFLRSLCGEILASSRSPRRARVLALSLLQLLVLASIAGSAGSRALVVYLAVTFLARGVVALVNYVQHYGLGRAAGEKPSADHAWDLPFPSANWLYFNAGLHADHHIKASLAPGELCLRSTRFLLPFNISIILPMALVPPLFFRTVHPRLERAAVLAPLPAARSGAGGRLLAGGSHRR